MSLMRAVNKGCSGTYKKCLLACLFPTSEVCARVKELPLRRVSVSPLWGSDLEGGVRGHDPCNVSQEGVGLLGNYRPQRVDHDVGSRATLPPFHTRLSSTPC